MSLSAPSDEAWMRRALRLAARARGSTAPNPMVGAVLVRDERVVGEGYHRVAGGPHAEVLALRAAGEAARGATCYVTLEPCCHFGRTAPCSRALIEAGVARVVAAMADPFPRVAGGGLEELRRAGIAVEAGLLEAEARRLNEAYLKYVTQKLPFVTLKMAMTLDGKIATATGDSRWITGEVARRAVHRWRAESGAVMVGIGTALADDPLLTVRLSRRRLDAEPPARSAVSGGHGKDLESPPGGGGREGRFRSPTRVIVDARAELPLNSQIGRTLREVPTIVAASVAAPPDRCTALEAAGAHVLRVPEIGRSGSGPPDPPLLEGVEESRRTGEPAAIQNPISIIHNRIDLRSLMTELARLELSTVLVEGGAGLAAGLLDEGLVDRIVVFVAPKLVGGRGAPGPVGGAGFALMRDALPVHELTVRRYGPDIALIGYVHRPG